MLMRFRLGELEASIDEEKGFLELEIPSHEVDYKIVREFREAFGLTRAQTEDVAEMAASLSFTNRLMEFHKDAFGRD